MAVYTNFVKIKYAASGISSAQVYEGKTVFKTDNLLNVIDAPDGSVIITFDSEVQVIAAMKCLTMKQKQKFTA